MKKVAVTETFLEVQPLIHDFVNQFYTRYRIDKDRLVSAAYLGFMQAYDSYDPKIAEFTTWVGTKVQNRLRDEVRRYVKEYKKYRTGHEEDYLESVPVPAPPPEFDEQAFLQKLTEDAKVVAALVLTKPIDVQLLLRQLGPESPANWRQAMREYLTEIDWSPERVRKSFLEVKGAL